MWLLPLLALGCGSGPEPSDRPMQVMAAASLSEVMPALLEGFEASSGTRSELALGATGSLAAQLQHGAPADLFFAADEKTVERLVQRGLVDPASARVYAVGELVVVGRPGLPPPDSLPDIADPRYAVIAIANPEIAPYGAAAREALRRAGLWEAVEARIVQGENIAQTYQLAQTGNAELAFVARSLVEATTPSMPVDAALHAPIRQAAGVVTTSTHPAAGPFLEFVLGPQGRAILARFGFGAPS